tara:strand:- start:582 stop:1322 length:741 start_codon:yes stop_codon:yes gene_type:complete
MNKNICIVTNTTSKNSDVWKMFYNQIKKHFPQHVKIYTFSDISNEEFIGQTFLYDKNLKFRSQFLSCIKKVPEDYCIFVSEDYILYKDVDAEKIKFLQSFLKEEKDISFIKLFKGADFKEPLYKGSKNLFELSLSNPYFFSQSATLWRTRDLEKIFEKGPDMHIAGEGLNDHFELGAQETCKELNLKGLYYYNNEPKRGIYHHDCSIFPHVATALVKGKWNLSEYYKELMPLLIEYEINSSERGIY